MTRVGLAHVPTERLRALYKLVAAGKVTAPVSMPALMLAVLFVGSTGYVVVSSGARNAETSGVKTARIADTNAARARELAQLAQSEAMYRAATDRVTAECKSGDGPRCRGARAPPRSGAGAA